MGPGPPRQIASLFSKLSSSCGIPEIVYLACRKCFQVISQPFLNVGPTALDANGGTFVASLVPHERAAKASACSRWARYQFGSLRRRPRKRSEEHTSELQSHVNLVCRLLLEKKKKNPPTPKVRKRIEKKT